MGISVGLGPEGGAGAGDGASDDHYKKRGRIGAPVSFGIKPQLTSLERERPRSWSCDEQCVEHQSPPPGRCRG